MSVLQKKISEEFKNEIKEHFNDVSAKVSYLRDEVIRVWLPDAHLRCSGIEYTENSSTETHPENFHVFHIFRYFAQSSDNKIYGIGNKTTSCLKCPSKFSLKRSRFSGFSKNISLAGRWRL